MARRADGREKGAYRKIEIETRFLKDGFIKTPIEPRKPGTKFREAETEAEAGRKKYYKAEPKPSPSKTTFKEAEAEAKANNFRMFGSRSLPGSKHFAKSPASGSQSQSRLPT